MKESQLLFQEEQRFRQKWLLALAGLYALTMVGLFGWAAIQQLGFGRPWGTKPMSDGLLALVAPAMILAGLGLPAFLLGLRLRTEVRGDRVELRLRWIARRTIPLSAIRSAAAETYRPILEFGGWGYRVARGKRAFTISGNRGVRLKLEKGPEILIGSQRAEELEAAIAAARRRAA